MKFVRRMGTNLRKPLFVSLFILLGTLLLLYNFRPWIVPNTYVSGWGSSSTADSVIQRIKFNATIKNDGHYSMYVKEIQALFSEAIKSNFQSGDQKITISKWLKPNETMDVSGEWLFSTLGIKDNNICSICAQLCNLQSQYISLLMLCPLTGHVCSIRNQDEAAGMNRQPR